MRTILLILGLVTEWWGFVVVALIIHILSD